MKRYLSFFLVLSVLNISCATISQTHLETYPRKKGADLIIQKADGHQLRGWLIAVKENSLLLMERDSRTDVSVDVVDIRTITHVRKPKLLLRVGIGLLAFLVVLTGTVIWADVFGPPELAEQGPPFLGLTAGLIVFFTGGFLLKNKTYQIEGKSDAEIQKILEQLRQNVRDKN